LAVRRHLQNDFSMAVPAIDASMGLCHLFKRKDAIDEWSRLLPLEERSHLVEAPPFPGEKDSI
jgi:hypothetical protein